MHFFYQESQKTFCFMFEVPNITEFCDDLIKGRPEFYVSSINLFTLILLLI